MNQAQLIGKVMIIGLLTIMTFSSTDLYARNGNNGSSLSDDETDLLQYMREEEKMARDVYSQMFTQWGTAIFDNIASSEQQHTDTILKMLNKYGVPDPAMDDIGEFTNIDLQEKYNELIAIGLKSDIDALWVGATIEEIDMVDIQEAIDITNNIDIVNAYQSLLEGSKSHLRAYVGTLQSLGYLYVPQFISQELFDAIMEL